MEVRCYPLELSVDVASIHCDSVVSALSDGNARIESAIGDEHRSASEKWSSKRTVGVDGQSARWSLSASSSAACSSAVIDPTRGPMRSTVIDRTCSACAFESSANPVPARRAALETMDAVDIRCRRARPLRPRVRDVVRRRSRRVTDNDPGSLLVGLSASHWLEIDEADVACRIRTGRRRRWRPRGRCRRWPPTWTTRPRRRRRVRMR